jgi:plasmid stabilization system protein ParE
MSYQVIIQPRAEKDIRQALRWITRHSPKKATLWYFDIMQAIDSLKDSPARCPFAPERKTFGLGIRHLLFDQYRILFVIEDVTVSVLRVRHQAQDTLKPRKKPSKH